MSDYTELVKRLLEPKAWMAWHDYGKVTINGNPIPPMDHDSDAPRKAADALIALQAEVQKLIEFGNTGSIDAANWQAKYWAMRERAETAKARVKELEAENSKLRSALEIVHFKQEPWQ